MHGVMRDASGKIWIDPEINTWHLFAMETALTPQVVRDKAHAARVSLSQFLRLAKVSTSAFYQWEKGGITPRDLTIARLEDAVQEVEEGK